MKVLAFSFYLALTAAAKFVAEPDNLTEAVTKGITLRLNVHEMKGQNITSSDYEDRF